MMSLPTQLKAQGGYWRTSWRDDDGERRWASFGNAKKVKKTDALEAYETWLKDWHNDETVRNPNHKGLTIGELAGRYQDHAKIYYRRPDGTQTREASNIKHAVAPLAKQMGDGLVIDFSPAKLKEHRSTLVRAKLARNTINKRVAKIRAMFRWGVNEELVEPSIWHGLAAVDPLKRGRTTATETEAVKAVHGKDIDKVRSLVPEAVLAMIDLQLLTGMRPTEVCIMRGIDLDTASDVWLYRPEYHKTQHHGKERSIPIGPKAQAIIKPYLQRDLRGYLFRSGHHKASLPHYNRDSYYQAVMRACTRAKVTRWSPGQLRHNAATTLRAEYGLEAAKVILGHSKIETTQVYAEADLERAKQIMREVG